MQITEFTQIRLERPLSILIYKQGLLLEYINCGGPAVLCCTATHTHTGERGSPSITCWCGPQRLLAAHALYLWLSLENTSPPAKEWGREFRNLKKEGLPVWNKYTFVQYRERERERADVGQRRQLSFNNCGRLCCWCRPGYCAFWLTLIFRREADRKGVVFSLVTCGGEH